ncbi:MAG TPA: GNAT family N-acetyltransferase [archaeon]|nr:GNAT family N-acetyltransferase [archaeon]
MKITIRKFKEGDAYELAELIDKNRRKISSLNQSQKALKEMAARNTPPKLIEKSKDRSLFVAEFGSSLVGTAGLKGSQVTGVFVKVSQHGKGIGKKLMEKVEGKAEKKGVKKVFLYSSIYAVPFYEKLGYGKASGGKKETDVVYREMVLMSKSLS